VAESFPPRVSCVYQILCVPTGKIYIGSARDLRTRWARHRGRLRQGQHENKPLQQAWNKYGETNFRLSILELVRSDQLLTAEQAWIDGSGCTRKGVGFNVRPIAGAAGQSLWLTWEGFIDPSGQPVTIENLWAHCRAHDLSPSVMHQLAHGRGRRKSHKGWTYRNRTRKRPYPYVKTWSGFVNPQGNPVPPITNLAAFCRERGLTHSHMIAVAAGRICSHQGWTHELGRKPLAPKIYGGFVDPTGRRVVIRNLSEFCRHHGLSVVHMHNLKSGVRRSHKGWTWRPEDAHQSSQ
jgi:hypothetical protein